MSETSGGSGADRGQTKLSRQHHGDAKLAESVTVMYPVLTFAGSYRVIMSVGWQTSHSATTLYSTERWSGTGPTT